jgi:hypothetical protein
MNNLNQFVDSIIKDGASAFNLATGMRQNNGYLASTSESSITQTNGLRESIETTLRQFIWDYGSLLSIDENSIMGRIDDGNLILSIAKTYSTKSEAIRMSNRSVFDLSTNETIHLL